MPGFAAQVFAALVFAALVITSPPAGAQTRPPAEQAAPAADPRAEREKELRRTEQSLQENEARRLELQRDVARLREDRARLTAELIETSRKVRQSEEKFGALQQRAAELEASEQALQRSLGGRRETIVEVLAALQRIGRRPPPAVLVRPEDALEAVRSSIMLGAVLPELRQEALIIAADLAALVKVRAALAADLDALKAEGQVLAEGRVRLDALVEARQQRLGEAEKALGEARAQAGALARQAESLKELIARMESENAAARRAAEAAVQAPKPALSQSQIASLAENAFRDPARLAPKIAFSDTRGTLPLPVSGSVSRLFGASDSFGGQERGLTLSTGPGAIVTMPADGWVAFAGPFRSYRNVLIINAGGGYHVVLIGADRVTVEVGQFVLAGEPVALMAAASAVDGQDGETAGRPALYIEFRKDGAPIDPSPWWAKSDVEKARG